MFFVVGVEEYRAVPEGRREEDDKAGPGVGEAVQTGEPEGDGGRVFRDGQHGDTAVPEGDPGVLPAPARQRKAGRPPGHPVDPGPGSGPPCPDCTLPNLYEYGHREDG